MPRTQCRTSYTREGAGAQHKEKSEGAVDAEWEMAKEPGPNTKESPKEQ